MDRIFKTLNANVKVDLIPYIKEYMKEYPDVEILIGCDSQNRKRETVYAVVIGLYRPRKGAHVLYSRNTVSRIRIKENVVRLLGEVWYSVEVAEFIKSELGIVATYIDIDLNYDERWQSNKALAEAIGIIVGMGYKVRYKNHPQNNTPMITYMCDHLVK